MADYPSLKNKVLYITGGASGIGHEIVEQFSHLAVIVGFFDKDAKGARSIVDEFDNVAFEKVVLRDAHALKAAFLRMSERIGEADFWSIMRVETIVTTGLKPPLNIGMSR